MELWIRSQDKTTLIRSYEIYIVEHSNSYVIRAKRTSHILGAYKTIERALEVLEEIEERICLLQIMELAKGNENALINVKNAIGEGKIKGLGYPYQMPKE